MNEKHVFQDLPFNWKQMVGTSPCHYGRCLLSYLLGCRQPRQRELLWLRVLQNRKKKRKRRKAQNNALHPPDSWDVWGVEGAVLCDIWLHRYASGHGIHQIEGAVMLPIQPLDTSLLLVLERNGGPRIASGALPSREKRHQISWGQLPIPWECFSFIHSFCLLFRGRQNKAQHLTSNTGVASCFYSK